MSVRFANGRSFSRAAAAWALFALGFGLGGCADMSDSMTTAFADPAKYDLYDCKQLEKERKTLSDRAAELQGLMVELAYRNEYVSVRGQSRFAEEAWQRNKCRPSPPTAGAPAIAPVPPANPKGRHTPGSSGSAVY
jgi:hypothetical protein